MGPIRRKQLVDGVIAVIHEQGFAHATVARIARKGAEKPAVPYRIPFWR